MTRNARNRFVAWLGIAAMWLAIVAPVISQTLAARAAADDPLAALCAVSPSGQAAHATSALLPSHDAASHHEDAGHFDACSYCGLLAHHLPVVPGTTPQAARIERVARVAPRAQIVSIHSKAFNAARPRAPPVLS
ncbi:DUF2946 domain-containing protein [Caballeronia sp. LZ043]|uniref:DUF2946 domain-containing protein n=1 Tax=Caballeronia sp. LZ043 TaxID=3038569 RepID=UPI0028612049|nr:DUF2946 domain-containing protein [Caballeronia sp. LZ043]MDR5820127.1 DUF2946 domain-containing protein [Caballeronia sp. LZ043]